MATIRVTLLEDQFTVDTLRSHNPLEVAPGEEVSWQFVDINDQTVEGALLAFRGFLPGDDITPTGGGIPTGPEQQPFTVHLPEPSPEPGPFTVADTARGLYLYIIILNDQVLTWARPLFQVGSFGPLFGGIIIKDPPPGGGPAPVS